MPIWNCLGRLSVGQTSGLFLNLDQVADIDLVLRIIQEGSLSVRQEPCEQVTLGHAGREHSLSGG